MSYLLRKIAIRDKKSIVGVVAGAVAGSVLINCATSDTNSKLFVSLLEPLLRSLSPHWSLYLPSSLPEYWLPVLPEGQQERRLGTSAFRLFSASRLFSEASHLKLSIPKPLQDFLTWKWSNIQDKDFYPAYLFFGASQPSRFPFFVSRTSADPSSSSDISKETSTVAGGGPKHSCNCLGRDTIANAAASAGPAVVNLSVPKGFHGLTVGKSIGSGTIIDADGTILTCAHVVVDFQGLSPSSKGKIDVTLQDGRTFEGIVENADLHSDIAIVKIKSKTPLPCAKLGSSTKLRPGDWVIAMGCPLSLQNTVTAGIVSCVDRKSSDLGLGGMRREYLQTDCAINAGNSGGPLVNIDGEVVGVNIMKVLAADGLGFSVPIDSVSKIIEHFKKNGRVVRPWLGLKMLDLNDMIVAQLKEKDSRFPNVNQGVLVPMVTPDSPAEHAGFHPGDVVIEFDGKLVGSIKEIIDIMDDRIGQPLKVVVKRRNNVCVTLTVIPVEANPNM
ncbi:PREDICTED: putative protease Do-like 14 isoform X2 [Ipomoea nil]|uniref:putative protease Do-like 14 isoform X2 n=1 Tax=Ipomoea nil TaxID=35883 RepID=UPI000901DA33|nr:PREDICTED: putative protease Do-like 14 isoform X2 [Ipomoea nil]